MLFEPCAIYPALTLKLQQNSHVLRVVSSFYPALRYSWGSVRGCLDANEVRSPGLETWTLPSRRVKEA